MEPGIRANCYVREAKALRMRAGLTLTELSALAKVSRDTLSHIENQRPVTPLVAFKLFNALNKLLDGGLRHQDYVTLPR